MFLKQIQMTCIRPVKNMHVLCRGVPLMALVQLRATSDLYNRALHTASIQARTPSSISGRDGYRIWHKRDHRQIQIRRGAWIVFHKGDRLQPNSDRAKSASTVRWLGLKYVCNKQNRANRQNYTTILTF